MSQTKRNIEAAAEALDVPVDELTEWIMSGEHAPFLEDGTPRDVPPIPGRSLYYLAAASLDVHPADLVAWRRGRNAGPYTEVPKVDGESVGDDLDERVAERTARDGVVREVVRDARGAPLVILEHRGLSGQTASTFVRPAAELVSEDDYRGVAADLIARWADDHVDAATVLASLNLAAHGMPVTTPSRRALSRVRATLTPYADGSRRMASDDLARDVLAILDEVGA